jgi:hypothetical protein
MEKEEENPRFGNLTVWIVMCISRKSTVLAIYKKVVNVCPQKGVCGTLLEHVVERTVFYFYND